MYLEKIKTAEAVCSNLARPAIYSHCPSLGAYQLLALFHILVCRDLITFPSTTYHIGLYTGDYLDGT